MTVRPWKPIVFGKPHAPMLDFAVSHTGAERPIFVGDRIDTDIMGANRAGMKSLLVFTGAHGKHDLLAAGPGDRPNYIGADLRALLEPARVATQEGHSWRCGAARAQLHDGRIQLDADLATPRQGSWTRSGRWRTCPGRPMRILPTRWRSSTNCTDEPASGAWAFDVPQECPRGRRYPARDRGNGGPDDRGATVSAGKQPATDLALIAVFAALIAVFSVNARGSVGPVPITLQTLAVILSGLVLGPWRGFAAAAPTCWSASRGCLCSPVAPAVSAFWPSRASATC